MRRSPRWVGWARASLLVALAGHAIANALLDEDQFAAAGLAYTWQASLPILIQAVVLLAVVASLGPIARRARLRSAAGEPRLDRRRLLGMFTAAQVALFGALELSERVVQHEPFVDGLLGSGFSLELVFALASAALLAALAGATARVIRRLRRRTDGRRRVDTYGRPRPSLLPRARPVLVAGGVRAPPSA